MWGDAEFLSVSAIGGNDTFVFVGPFGNDRVGDFRQGEDKIEFQVAGVDDFSDLDITTNGVDTFIKTMASLTDTVTLAGFIDGVTGTLTASDFVFA